jgi:hypothetical protein
MPADVTATVAVAAFLIALIALLLALLMGLRGLLRRRKRPARMDPGEFGPAVERALSSLDELSKRVESLEGKMPVVEGQGRRAVQRVGVVRFNPFEDTGGNQSFSLALLDSKADGIVITSLHSRQQTRVYLKSIVGGKCETALSDDESEALRRAGAA